MDPLLVDAAVQLTGGLQDRGRLAAFDYTINAKAQNADTNVQLNTSGKAVSVTGEALYVNFSHLDLVPDLFSGSDLSRVYGMWWKHSLGAPGQVRITSDPKILSLQASVVQVTKDLGIERQKQGKSHHYRIALDQAKFMEFLAGSAAEPPTAQEQAMFAKQLEQYVIDGELWIDTESYLVQRIVWNAKSVRQGGAQVRIDIGLAPTPADFSVQIPDSSLPLTREMFVTRLALSNTGAARLPTALPLPLAR